MGCVQTRPGQSSEGAGAARGPPSLPEEYSAEGYSEGIKQALDNEDSEFIIRALLHCNLDQRHEICNRLQADHDISLGKECCDRSSGGSWPQWVGFSVELLLQSPWQSCAAYLQRLLQSQIVREITAVETICSRDSESLKKVVESYSNVTEGTARSLTDDLTARCSPEVAEVLTGFLSHGAAVSDISVHEYVNELIEASNEGDLFEGKRLFLTMMSTVPIDKLKEILELYLKQSQRDFSVEMEKYYKEGRTLDCFKAAVGVLRNRPLHLATRLSESLKASGDPESQLELCYILLVANNDELRELKLVYKNTFFEMLSRDIRDEVKDTQLQKTLLLAVK